MAIDTRDWYRERANAKDGYVEQASFRISDGERARQADRRAWRRNFIVAGAVVTVISATVAAVRLRRRK
jgi:hypothetical protein